MNELPPEDDHTVERIAARLEGATVPKSIWYLRLTRRGKRHAAQATNRTLCGLPIYPENPLPVSDARRLCVGCKKHLAREIAALQAERQKRRELGGGGNE